MIAHLKPNAAIKLHTVSTAEDKDLSGLIIGFRYTKNLGHPKTTNVYLPQLHKHIDYAKIISCTDGFLCPEK